jgi:hydroxyacylglutathione hydrolase
MKVVKFTFNPFQENTHLLIAKKSCWIVDPGCYTTQERQELVKYVEDNELAVEAIINTHCHLDHVFGNQFLCKHFGAELWAPFKDDFILKNIQRSADLWGIPNVQESPEPTVDLNKLESLELAGEKVDLLQLPGHTPGHVALSRKEEGYVVAGDVLFSGSIGRTDLPGGDHDTLIDSIKSVMFKLPDDTVVYCGHGPETTVGTERRSNPFLQ